MGYIMDLRETVGTTPLIMAGSAVLVFNSLGELLLQRRTDSLDWGTTGGAMELGESFEETAVRELYEEAGLRAKTLKLITVLSGKDMYYQYPNGDEIYNVMAIFEAYEIDGPPTINDNESLELKYFSLEQPIAQLNPFTEHYLRKAGYIKNW